MFLSAARPRYLDCSLELLSRQRSLDDCLFFPHKFQPLLISWNCQRHLRFLHNLLLHSCYLHYYFDPLIRESSLYVVSHFPYYQAIMDSLAMTTRTQEKSVMLASLVIILSKTLLILFNLLLKK